MNKRPRRRYLLILLLDGFCGQKNTLNFLFSDLNSQLTFYFFKEIFVDNLIHFYHVIYYIYI